MMAKLQEIVRSVSKHMQEKENLRGRTVTLKIKDAAFVIRTRAKTLSTYTNSEDVILRTALALLKPELQHCKKVGVRLLGVRISSFFGAADVAAKGNSRITACTSTAAKSGGNTNAEAACQVSAPPQVAAAPPPQEDAGGTYIRGYPPPSIGHTLNALSKGANVAAADRGVL